MNLQASISTGVPLTCFLAPPVDTCLQCSARLHVHNHPVRVVCYTQDGPVMALKLTLRCRGCGLNYRYEQYGSTKNGGYRYYNQPRPYVQASQVCYVDRVTCEQWIAARYTLTVLSLLVTNFTPYCQFCSHHAWTSFDASAEIYNELYRETSNTNLQYMEQYLNAFPLANSHLGSYSMWLHVHGTFIAKFVLFYFVGTGDDSSKKFHSNCTSLKEVHSKTVASAFWSHQVEVELRERGWEEYLFVSSSSREDCIKKIDEKRARSVYPHHESDCSEECKQRGKLYILTLGLVYICCAHYRMWAIVVY